MTTKKLLVMLTALSLPMLAQAEEGKKCDREHKGCEERRARFLEKFDKDGDGKLSDEEREAAKAAREQHRAEMKERRAAFIAAHDTDGDGKLSPEERKAARDAFIAKYDTDGDGKLSKEERQLAKDAGAVFPGGGKHGCCHHKCHGEPEGDDHNGPPKAE